MAEAPTQSDGSKAYSDAMSTPAAPLADKENVQDVTETPEENTVNSPSEEKTEDKTVATVPEDADPALSTELTADDDKDDQNVNDKDQSEDIEEGKPVKRLSVAPRSPSQMGRSPPPKRKPLWLYMVIFLVVFSFIGALVITVVSATRGGLTKTAMGFLIFFAVVLVCVAPIACYTRANFFAMGMVHD